MALRIFVHDCEDSDSSGPPLGMVDTQSNGDFCYCNLRERLGEVVGGYPTYEEALRDLIDELDI